MPKARANDSTTTSMSRGEGTSAALSETGGESAAVHQETEVRLPSEDTAWHALPGEAVISRLATGPGGLSPREAGRRLAQWGPNLLPTKKPPTVLALFLRQFLSPLIYVLLAAAIVSIAIGEATDAGFILAVILINAAIGTWQEWKAERSAQALQKLLRITARVIRNGHEEAVPAEGLVPGDIIRLESGNRIPADVRLLQAANFNVDESILTGESAAASKSATVLPESVPLSERANMAHAGTTVTSGRAKAVVVATGARTEVGRIAREAAVAPATKPPLVQRMEKFARQISFVVILACLFLGVVLVAKGYSYQEVFFLSVALAVAAIPEGLPVALTVALSIATMRMARRNVIVRRLTAVESLGSCTVIASDKTGTLTVNQQTVKLIHLPDGERYQVSGEGYSGHGRVYHSARDAIAPRSRARLERLARAGILCNEAQLRFEGERWEHQGDPMDVALLALGYKLGLDAESVNAGAETVAEIPFESERKFSARFYRGNDGLRVAVKGAEEVVVGFCCAMLTDRGLEDLDRRTITEVVRGLAENGYRVLAIADGDLSSDGTEGPPGEDDLSGLTLLGLVAFIDPLKPEVNEAVAKCRSAGVEVAMITGDHPRTAMAIAREVGIAGPGEEAVAGEAMLLETAGKPSPRGAAKVYARVTPLQKQQIVGAMVDSGHFVAVTGDGVNDAPALRKANIGVAMGSGTDVAKDVASIIVTDDNFASIVAGIEEGRYAYDNVRKVIFLLVSTGAAEIVLFLASVTAGLPIPLFAVQLLWLNLVTNGIQHVALAFEGGEPGAMARPPRRPSEGIFNGLMIRETAISGMAMGLLAFSAWHFLLDRGWEETAARNILLLLMVFLENMHVFNCRSETVSAFRVPLRRNPLLLAGVLGAQGVHILAMHVPLLQDILQVRPISPAEWFSVLGVAALILVVMEIFKAARKLADFRHRTRLAEAR